MRAGPPGTKFVLAAATLWCGAATWAAAPVQLDPWLPSVQLASSDTRTNHAAPDGPMRSDIRTGATGPTTPVAPAWHLSGSKPSRIARYALRLPGTKPPSRPTAKTSSENLDFFEREIRPLLAEHCFSCHGPRVQQSGLRLDSRQALFKGGTRGPALGAGKLEDSLLLRSVRHDGLQMPPGKKLPDRQIAALEKWLRLGAPWPDAGGKGPGARGQNKSTIDNSQVSIVNAPTHWSFRPLRRPAVPDVRMKGWVKTPIDAFVLARLEKAGLKPSPAADRRTLLRRVYFDLIGLPPTPEEMDAFLVDRSPAAYEKVVDRLLASPHYGERWGRHWLDVARYADTKDGVLMFGPNRIRPFAYTYRDYVIRALNEDTPFDRFVHEQLAADQIQPPVEPWRLAAMGYLTLGKMFDNNVHDVIDDRIDVVTRGFMGLTVSCARCHDHKYDPIPTADYYSLYGIFASSEAPLELPRIERPEDVPGSAEFEKAYAAKRAEIAKFLDEQFTLQSETARKRTGDYLVRVATEKPDPLETAIFFLSLAPEDLRPQIVARWRKYLERRARPEDPVFGPWHDLMQLPENGFTDAAQQVATRWLARPTGTAPRQLNPLVGELLAGAPFADRAAVARAYGALILRAHEESRNHKSGTGVSPATSAPRAGTQERAQWQLLEILGAQDSPAFFPRSQTWHYMSRGEKDKYAGMLVELDRLAVTSQKVPARAMVLNDAPELLQPRIFVRGNPSQPGDAVPRQFLAVLSGSKRQPFVHGSGRLDLARAITSPDNPLTARVIVNRVWMHHFGEPLVATPGDFGSRSTPPTHPELLDYLASRFAAGVGGQEPGKEGKLAISNLQLPIVNSRLSSDAGPQPPAPSHAEGLGWSLKKLHRLLVTSSVYRQASLVPATSPAQGKAAVKDPRVVDPENRLLWHYHRRRLDLEAMRDGILHVAGRLDPAMGGRPVDIVGEPANQRRTVYGLVDRQGLPGLFRNFDFANPDQSADRRPQTTVPQQALFALNSPFVVEQAKALAARPEITRETEPAARIAALYRRVLLREPNPAEVSTALRFLAAAGTPPEAATDAQKSQLTPWEQLSQILLLTNEFLFID